MSRKKIEKKILERLIYNGKDFILLNKSCVFYWPQTTKTSMKL